MRFSPPTKRRSMTKARATAPAVPYNYERPEYRHWINMKSRCCNKNTPGYQRYGGRGIRVCERWLISFDNFLADMGKRPSPNHSLDRINNDGDYEPRNCRWALPNVQMRNMARNHIVTFRGMEMTLAEAVESAPVPYNTVLYRLKRGWSINDAITRKPKKGLRP